MIGRRRIFLGFATVALGLALLPGVGPAQQAQSPPTPMKIGMANSLFRDVPAALVQRISERAGA